MSDLYKKHNYINKDITMLRSTIKEYDMEEGGFSIIKEFQLLPLKDIDYLEKNFDKKGRHIEIGKLQQNNKKLAISMMEGFIECRKIFFEENDLDENNILSIKKDAIFVFESKVNKIQFGKYINFRPKGKYSHYIRLNNVEFYYSIWKDLLDVKGLGGHNHMLFDKIKYFMRVNDKLNRFDMFKVMKKFRKEYLNFDLDLEFYRELNNKSFDENSQNFVFRLKSLLRQDDLILDEISDDMTDYLDISYNYVNYIIPLINNFI